MYSCRITRRARACAVTAKTPFSFRARVAYVGGSGKYEKGTLSYAAL